MDGASLMADILESSPKVTLLATSRERLGLRGESVYDVAGLEFSDWPSVEVAMRSSCALLFVQGVLQVHPQFKLAEPDLPHFVRICRLVDGTPLALLLSAAWMDMLSLEEIADEVASGLDFLETELRDAPARQRSVRAVFDTSWERLGAAEAGLVKRVSVFRGGFTRQAAEAVALANLKSLARPEDKSVIRRNPEVGRYEIHELLRQFGEERLLEDEQAGHTTRQAHAHYFADLLAAKAGPLTSGIEAEPLDEIEADIENIRWAWGYLAETGDAEALQQSLFALWFFHEVRCWLHAGKELLATAERSLKEAARGVEIDLVANQLSAAGAFFDLMLGFPEQAVETAGRTLNWLREHDYQDHSTYSLLTLGVTGNFTKNWAEAIANGDALSTLGKRIGNQWWELRGKTMASGGAYLSGDLERSERYLNEYDELIAGSRGPWNSFWGRQMYARLAEARSDYATAIEINQSILDSLQPVSFLRGMQYAYTTLGRINLVLDELDGAEYNYAQSLRISQETGQIRDALGSLLGLAWVWQGQGRGLEAAEAVASVLHHPQIDQAHLLSRVSIREEAEALRTELERELEPNQYAGAWKAGSGEEAEDVIIRILSDLDEPLEPA